MPKTIHVISFDFDNCLFHVKYRWETPPNENEVIDKNKPLLDEIKADSANYDLTIAVVGSNRQSKAVDDALSAHATEPTESSYVAIQKVCKYLNAILDPLLLADIYGDLRAGTSFRNATNPHVQKHAGWIFDTSKLSILYAQIHKIAMDYPNDQIVFDFYDDKGCGTWNSMPTLPGGNLLERLESFFKTNSTLLPANTTLRLHHYKGGVVTPYTPIQGSGFIDENYRETVRQMAQISTKKKHRISCVDCVSENQLTMRKPLTPREIPLTSRHGEAGFFNLYKRNLGALMDTDTIINKRSRTYDPS